MADFLDMTTVYNNIPVYPHTSIGWSYSMRRSMQEIIPGLFLGPYLSALKTGHSSLLDNGITHIICVRQDIEAHYIKPQFNDSSFTYMTLDIADMVTESIIRFFPKVRSFIDDAFSAGGKVLVHGNNGNSRSATLVLAYIMEKYGINYKEAIKFVKDRRACIKPNEGFLAQLAEYEPIYRARQTLELGEGSSSSTGGGRQRRKRKSEQLTETVEGDLIQPPSSPASPTDDRTDQPYYGCDSDENMMRGQYQQQHLSKEVHEISNHLHRLWMLKSA